MDDFDGMTIGSSPAWYKRVANFSQQTEFLPLSHELQTRGLFKSLIIRRDLERNNKLEVSDIYLPVAVAGFRQNIDQIVTSIIEISFSGWPALPGDIELEK